MAKNSAISPMALRINTSITCNCYSVGLPEELKRALFDLEEKKHRLDKKQFNRDVFSLPMYSLQKCLENYFGACVVSNVKSKYSYGSWIKFINSVDASLLKSLLREWIKEVYSGNELSAERDKALSVLDTSFNPTISATPMELSDENGNINSDAYTFIPAILAASLAGEKVLINDEEAELYMSDNGELVTNPLAYTDYREKNYFSYVVKFKLETLPPDNKVIVVVDLSSRRWISTNKTGKVPFISDGKTVYRKIAPHMLQKIDARYRDDAIRWSNLDLAAIKIVHGITDIPSFETVITHPEAYMTGSLTDFYITYEYGIKAGGSDMHTQKSGITTQDRYQLFTTVADKLSGYCSVVGLANNQLGNCGKSKPVFDKNYCVLEGRESVIDKLKSENNTIYEIAYTVATKKATDMLAQFISNFDSSAVIRRVAIDDLIEPLEIVDEKSSDNLKGVDKRMNEARRYFPATSERTITFFVIHGADYYKKPSRGVVDPKMAIRKALLDTGRLSQFVTEEALLDEKSSIENILRTTFADGLRQLGFFLPFNSFNAAEDVQYAGVYVLRDLKWNNTTSIKMLPVAVTVDFESMRVNVASRVSIVNRTKEQKFVEINCAYSQFVYRLAEVFKKNPGCIFYGDKDFLIDWFERGNAKRRVTMCISDKYTRRYIAGISNASLAKSLDKSHKVLNFTDDRSVDLNNANVDLIRLRVNDEVPDYIPTKNSKGDFSDLSGIFTFDDVYYSKVGKPDKKEGIVNLKDSSKVRSNSAYMHRNIYEFFPIYVSDPNNLVKDLKDIHTLRNCNIQFENNNTILPLPLHMAKKLGEYFE